MPSITIGQTSKKINSTSQTFSGTTLSCKYKVPTSIQSPVLEVQGLTKGVNYNYASIGNNYYWVDDVVYLTNNIQEIHCHLDPLATYKTAISNTKALCVYGDDTKWNKLIDDVRFSPEMRLTAQAYSGVNMFGITTSNVGCVSMTFTQTASVDWMSQLSTTTPCGVHTAIMSMSDMRACIGDLTGFDPFPSDYGLGAWEIIQAFSRFIQSTGGASIESNIKSIIWLPFDLTDLKTKLGATQKLGLMIGGVFSPNCTWYEVSNMMIYTKTFDVAMDWDFLTDSHDFLKNDRFCSIQIFTPAGYHALPTQQVKYTDKLYFKTAFSVTDGTFSLRVSDTASRNNTLLCVSGNIGIDVSGTVNMGSTLSGAIADMGAGFVSGALAMGVGSLATTSYTRASQIKGEQLVQHGLGDSSNLVNVSQTSTSAGIGGSIPQTNFNVRASSGTFGNTPTALFLSSNVAEVIVYANVFAPYNIYSYADYCDMYGYPVNEFLKLGDMSGYIQCAGASVQGASGASEANKATINSYLNGGFYLE